MIIIKFEKKNFKGVIHTVKTLDIGLLISLRQVQYHQRNQNWTVFFIFYKPLKMRAADILSMLKDRANGGRARFQVVNNFLTSSQLTFLNLSQHIIK
jgi:hypothetical protein